ncbi:hypothetical protein CQW23_08509 [Capsicum baccatum]|uniref:Uncharacterized protein n=1 Tax=Capsicum baccatum TaxID=33114 RepID=A0A2G2X9A4_CAPBA|nr:hypothetical protein CQW23_08509 [Capsicum baccatum]
MCKPVLIVISGEFQFVTIDMFLCKAITCKWLVHMIIMHVKCLMKILSHKVSAGELYFASVFPRSLSFSSQIMVPMNYAEFIDTLTSLVKNNFIPMTRIDDVVRRILRVKFTLGLFENPLADYRLVKHIGSQTQRDLAREAVRKSLVVLKNGANVDKPMLPLPKKGIKNISCWKSCK